MSALDRIRQAFPELANASDSEVLGEAARRTGLPTSQIADTLGIKPSSTTYEVGRQLGAGFAVDLPRMAGQALQYFSDAGGERVGEGAFPRLGRPTGLERQYGVQISEPAPAYRAGRALVESAEARAPEWEPDLRGRGLVGEALVTGARAVGPMVPAVASMFAPGGQAVGLATQAALFGGSAAQDEAGGVDGAFLAVFVSQGDATCYDVTLQSIDDGRGDRTFGTTFSYEVLACLAP